MIKVLNLGCGRLPIKNTPSVEYVNVDMIKHPQIVKHNLTKFPYPFSPDHFDKIMLCHVIEHIPEEFHSNILLEMRRILKPDGQVAISYPEFAKVAQNYLDNKDGNLDLWKASIYGRGTTEFDRHKALMDTRHFIPFLKVCGFQAIKIYPEKRENYHTVVIAEKCERTPNIEDLMAAEIEAM